MKIKNIILTGSEGLIGRSFRSYAEKKGYNLFTTAHSDFFELDNRLVPGLYVCKIVIDDLEGTQMSRIVRFTAY